MKKNGFVTSALLYGILSLFLLLILGSLTVMTNRKLTDDQIRRSALDDVQTLTTDPACFTVSGNTITGYSDTCDKTVFIPETIGGVNITAIGSAAFQNKKLINITIKDNITSIDPSAFNGNDGMFFIMKMENGHIPHDNTEVSAGRIWGSTNSTIRRDE